MPITAQEIIDIEPGVYEATLDSWSIEDGQFGQQVKFVFVLDEQRPDGSPWEKWYWCSLKLTPRSKLWDFLTQFGTKLTLGTTYEEAELLDPLIGRRVSLVIRSVPGANGPQSRITEVLASKGQRAAVAEDADRCAVAGCDGGVDKYTKGGKPLCADHTADDL